MQRRSFTRLTALLYPLGIGLIITACGSSPSPSGQGGSSSASAPAAAPVSGSSASPAGSMPSSPTASAAPANPVIASARALVRDGKVDEALNQLKQALAAQPDDIALHRVYQDILRTAGRADVLRQEYSDRLKAGPPSALNQYLFGRSVIAESPGEAEQAFRAATAQDPNFLWAYLALGTLHSRRSDFTVATQLYEEILPRFPTSPDLHHNLAETYFNIGVYRRAIEFAEKTARLDPGYAPAYEIEGRAWYRLGDNDAARKVLEKALSLNPEMPNAHQVLAELNLKTGNKEQAKVHAQQAARLGAPLSPELKQQLGLP